MVNQSKVFDLDRSVYSEDILACLDSCVFVIDKNLKIKFLNVAAEQLFKLSVSLAHDKDLSFILPKNSYPAAIIAQVIKYRKPISEYSVNVNTPESGHRIMSIYAAPLGENQSEVMVSMQEHPRAIKIAQNIDSHGVRSVSAIAKLLAHEVKNPLSGIRGAAQLLEHNISKDDLSLTKLICEETDRIVSLVDRMEVFSDEQPIKLTGINIHRVLKHVKQISENGFGRAVNHTEQYDPSLPLVRGNKDQLIQVFLNLVKNAVEAVPKQCGEVSFKTRYQPGVRIKVPNSEKRLHLPLVVSIIDNGEGIPEDIKPSVFKPFITNKPGGNGLGLPLVAKIINEHGGIVEFDSNKSRTVFRVHLPIVSSPGH